MTDPQAPLQIAVFAPSGAILDHAAWQRGLARLAQHGTLVHVPDLSQRHFQRFAGDDAARLDELHQVAALAPDLAIAARGGYGVSRLLGDVNWDLIGQSVERGTHWMGFSDITALQLGLLAKTGQASWAGPHVCSDFGAAVPDDAHLANVWAVVQNQPWQIAFNCTYPVEVPFFQANGVLWGGNLAMIASLIGTPYLPRIKHGILFLEDVAEPVYRIERLLHQLLQAGILTRQKAIILGQFTDCKISSHDQNYDLNTIVDYFRAKGLPIFCGLPFGHQSRDVVLPVGLTAVFKIQDGRAQLSAALP